MNIYAMSLREKEVVDVKFVYRIEIFMAENAPDHESCWLESHHWLIKISAGTSGTVDGPGMVGQQPAFGPGSCHKYVSYTYFLTE